MAVGVGEVGVDRADRAALGLAVAVVVAVVVAEISIAAMEALRVGEGGTTATMGQEEDWGPAAVCSGLPPLVILKHQAPTWMTTAMRLAR